MKRHTQILLYHLLPVVFWLLAAGGAVVPFALNSQLSALSYFIPTAAVFLSALIITSLHRHESSLEQCFIVAVLFGIASYWLPTILFLVLPLLLYLYIARLYELRCWSAILLGYAFVAVWMAVLDQLSIIHYQVSIANNLFAWLPIGCLLLAWTASTIARRILRVR